MQDVKRMKYFWKSETMELESHQKICQGSRTKGILELQEETIKNQQGWGYICVRNFSSKLQLSFYIESKEEEYTKVTIGFPRNSMIF